MRIFQPLQVETVEYECHEDDECDEDELCVRIESNKGYADENEKYFQDIFNPTVTTYEC